MGSGLVMRCPKCGYEFSRMEGIGMLFPMAYEETVQKAKVGELGEELKLFFEKNPHGALNVEQVTLCCDQCGELSIDKDLTMYISKNSKDPHVSDNDKYIFEEELKRDYLEVMKYPHKCGKCGGDMHRVNSDEILKCPECKVKMEEVTKICWD